MSNLVNLNTKTSLILQKYKLENFDIQSKTLLKELDNITNSILKRDFLRKNINISDKYFDITENINIIIKKIRDVLTTLTLIKIKPREINLNNNEKYQKLNSNINEKKLEYENFQDNLFQNLTQKKNKLYYVLKDFYKSLSNQQKIIHNNSQNVINFRKSSNVENNSMINDSFKNSNENEVIISFKNEANNLENEANNLEHEDNNLENEKRLSLKSLGKIEQKHNSNSNSNSNSNNFYNPPHGNLPQNFRNQPLYENFDIKNPEIRKLENNLKRGLTTNINLKSNLSEYPNSYSNGYESIIEFNPLKNKKKISAENSNLSNIYSNKNSEFLEIKHLNKEFNIKNKNLKKINELNKIIVENKNLSKSQRMLYKDKIIDIMIMALSNKIRNKYHN